MIAILLRVIGLLLTVGALYAAWLGFEAHDDIRKWTNESIKQASENMSSRSRGEAGQKQLEEDKQQIEKKTVERNIWLGVAVATLVVGIGLMILPSSRKRKAPVAEPVPAPVPDQPAPQGDQPTPAGP